jgi:excisionase family DNA binding protein
MSARRLSDVNPDRLLDAREVAQLLNVPESWVREHTRSGTLPSVELGRYKRYQREALLSWLDSCTTGGGPSFRKHHPRART